MNIININSNIEMTPAQEDFIETVVLSDEHGHRMMEPESFYHLSKTAPIFLVNEGTMKKHDSSPTWLYGDESNHAELEYSDRNYEANSDFKPLTEWLGFYGRSSADVMDRTPRIVLCLERIKRCVNNGEEFMFLLAKVVVHELAHAKMDANHQNSKYRSKDTFWHWMEESMANYYTLECFDDYRMCSHNFNHHWAHDCFDFVKDFIKKQPPAYALGYELYDKRPILDWEWERCKVNLGSNQHSLEKAAWLKYMQKNYSSIDENKATSLYENVFQQDSAKNNLREKIKNNDPNITQQDLNGVLDMSGLFEGIKTLSCDISGWDVSGVIYMDHMFKRSTINPDITKWNVGNVESMRGMFEESAFDQNISRWKVQKLNDTTDMFKNHKRKGLAGRTLEEYLQVVTKLGTFAKWLDL